MTIKAKIFNPYYCDICPHCEAENPYDGYDVDYGYVKTCRACGEKILLCDACIHAKDNTDGFCDWYISRQSEHYQIGKCFRGLTINLK